MKRALDSSKKTKGLWFGYEEVRNYPLKTKDEFIHYGGS